MSLYKIDRSRNISYKGKFKFDYTIDLTSSRGAWTGIFYTRGAYIEFRRDDEFTAQCVVANTDPATPDGTATFTGHPFDGTAGFGGIFYNFQTNSYEVRLNYRIKGKKSHPGYFVLSNQSPPNANDQINSGGDGFQGTGFIRTIRGSIEGYFFDNEPLDEYVEVSEYYPSEVKKTPGNCPGSTDEYWVNKDLDENTVRQWPKYTTLNWFETTNPKGKRTVGIVVFHTDSNNKTSKFTATYNDSPSFFVSYTTTKQLNAWSQDDTSNSGYIIFSSNLEYNQPKIIPARTDRVTVDLDNFSIETAPKGYSRQAQIYVTSNPPRNVTFESVVKDWNQNHTDELTAYLVGFDSDGVNKVYDELGKEHPAPTYKKVTTNSGIFSAEQTYIYYESPSIRAREEGQDNSGVVPKSFNNTQRWIFGMIDGNLTKDTFDDLESPSKHYDYPDKWVTRLSLGEYYCVNINQLSQDLTIDENDLPSGSNSIPIPLRGWKFNAMSLVQKSSFSISGTGNIRDFSISDNMPKYYGNLNLSGYRYLDINVKSKTNSNQKFQFKVVETSKGPTTLGNGFNLLDKTWDLNTSSNVFEKIRIDLCNPDNKTDNVDNQDSPYPRLNTYTTSKPQNLLPFGYLSEINKPKENKLITKPNLNNESKNWINKSVADKIGQAGIIYITDPANGYIDYFEVDAAKLPKSDAEATNIIYGKPRVFNGKVKLAKYWNGQQAELDPSYRKVLYLYIPKNDLTKGKTIEQLLEADKDGKYPKEFQLYNYDTGYPDVTEKLSTLTRNYADNQAYIYLNKISIYENNEIVPYDAIILVDTVSKVTRKYEIIQYVNNVQDVSPYVIIKPNATYDQNLVFTVDKTDVFLGFYAPDTDDKFRTGYVKFDTITKSGNIYQANIEYFKYELTDNPITEGIPATHTSDTDYNYFTNDTPLISLEAPRLVEYDFPINSTLQYNIVANEVSQNEVNAIDDYPQDENTNELYYGVSRVKEINIDNDNAVLGDLELVRNNSLSNFIYSGNSNTFEAKTKFTVAENSSTGIPTETTYYTRRFWQQNTDARDEEEGDINWQLTKSETLNNWQLFPKTISDLCDDINKIDVYVAPRWLNSSNPSSEIIRHPGWTAQKVNKGFSSQTRLELKESFLDPDYLNSNTGYATWIYGGGLMALPSGSNTGSGTVYTQAINVSFNEIKSILAQTIFHRINGDFPPGKPDLFGNTSLTNKDGTKQESTLHLRGGLIIRGPGHGLILPPKQSTPEDLRKANLIRTSDNFISGSDETDTIGYYETGSTYGRNNQNHFIKLEPTEKISNSDANKSSDRKIAQAKRERASFKPGVEKTVAVTSVSVVETGFENSLLFAYNVPSKTPFETVVISTDSFYDPFYEKNPIGFDVTSGTGQTIKGTYPYLLSSEIIKNKDIHPHSFVITEFDTAEKYDKSSSYKSNIGANLNFRDKNTWYPLRSGNVDPKLNFNQYTTIFEKTKFNGYCLSDYSPQIYCVGYADPGSIVLQTTHLSLSNVNSPNTDQVLHIDGKVPTDVAQFRLFEPISTVGTATTAFASVIQMKSREIMVAYSLQEEPRKIYYKIVSNNQVQAKNLLLDLDDLSGNTLNASYNIYGINSVYDKLANIHKTTFWSNGNVYYHEFDLDGSKTGNQKTSILHLVKGDANDKLASALSNKNLLKKYFDTTSGFATTIPAQRPGITSCQKQSYASHTIIAYQTGKCKIEAVLFKPFAETFLSSREFEIECPNETPGDTTGGGTGGDTGGGADTGGDTTGGGGGGDTTGGGGGGNNNTSKPNAKFTADPVSGTKDLSVTFTNLSTPFNDTTPIAKFKWDFYGDGTDLLETTNLDPVIFVYKNVGTFYPKLIAVDINNIESDVFNTIAITVNDIVNQPPTADFTFQQDTFLPPFLVTFTDISKDADGSIVSWNWNFGDSNVSTLQNPTNEYAIEGFYNVKLIVTDNLGKTGEIIKSITISRLPNKPPVPDFTYTQKLNTYTADFVNNSTDPENDSLVYDWILNEFDTNSNSNLKDPSYTYQVPGIYNVTLKATDTNSNSASITKQIQINDVINLAPRILDVTYSQTSYDPLTIKFSENSIDDDGYIEQWVWSFGDGNQVTITDSALKNVSHVYSSPGRYVASLTVTDNGLPLGLNKKTATRTLIVIVSPPPSNNPPLASFSVDNNNLPAIFTSTFTDQSSDVDGTIVSWLWELPNNQQILFDTTNYQKTVFYTFTKSGIYTVKLSVTDDKGSSSTATLDINVINQNPSALLSVSPNPVLSRNNVLFDASRSNDIDGNITSYSWDFGNGVKKLFGSNQENYIYNLPGTYTASVTVTDNLGAQSSAFVDVVVQNRNPFARITYDILTVKAPNSLSFSGTSSYDEDGTIVSYSWNIVNKTNNAVYFTSSSSVITVPFTSEGFYRVTLTVTDNLGATNSSSVDVTVTPADNIPPIAVLNVDKNSGKANDVFNFNFRGSYDPDANGSIIRYIINYGDNVEEVYTYAPFFVGHQYTSPGTYVAKLTVIDNRFGRSIETPQSVQTITITNQAPVANFSVAPTTVLTYEDVVLTDLSTDLENSIIKWTWNFGDGSPDLIIVDPLLVNQTRQYTKGDRDYNISLTVEDNFGLSNTISKTVTVVNRKPIALIKTDPLAINNVVTVEQNTTIVFTSDSYDIDGTIVAYEWYIVGVTSSPITTKNFYRAFVARDALYEVTLRVMDDQNLWSDTVSVFVKVQAPNTPPVVYLNANPPSGTASAPVTVFFDSNGTFDPDNPNELLTYFWDFGNGSFSSSPSASTTYSKAGSYNVYLDVTDRRGSTTNRNIIYVVNAATTGDTTGGTTTGPITNGDTTTGGTTTGGTTTGGTTTGGNNTGGNVNSTPVAPPSSTSTTTTVNNGTTNTTTNGTTTNWFNNPANQVIPDTGPIIDPNIQGAG